MSHGPRLARHDDLHAILEIVEAAYSPYVLRLGRRPGPLLDDYAQMIAEERVQVMEREHVVLGILVLIPHHDTMLLDNIAVSPAAQGMGIGRQLLDFAERSALAAGYHSIRLYTNEIMTENIDMYSRRGYSETHRVEEKGLRRVYMSKNLA